MHYIGLTSISPLLLILSKEIIKDQEADNYKIVKDSNGFYQQGEPDILDGMQDRLSRNRKRRITNITGEGSFSRVCNIPN